MFQHSVFSLARLGVACSAVVVLTVLPPAYAQAGDPAPAREAADANRAPELSLQASASSEVRQDTVRITLATEVEASSQTDAGKALTANLDDLAKRARGAKGIEVRTSGYNVWPNINQKGKIVNWRGRAEITLESRDFDAASALASKLGDKAAIANIGFLLSREGREAEERKLLSQAADAFRERALAAATAFDFSGYRLRHLELSGGGAPAPVPRAMMASQMRAKEGQADADVPLDAGEVTVSVAVNGTVVLH